MIMNMLKLPSVYETADYAGKPSKRTRRTLKKINQLQDYYRTMTDKELHRFARGLTLRAHKTGKIDVVKLFACAREVSLRLLGKFQYDVQIIGALSALERNVIQMSTGSGKTITLILPALYFGLTQKGCHVLTVNDYLSKRDWEETRVVYDYFGVTSRYVSADMDAQTRQDGFNCDITYCTNTCLGFSYLNSALASGIGHDIKMIDRPLHAALIDEVDEVLMDDARNPLIIADSRSLMSELTEVRHNGDVYKVSDIFDKLRTLSYLEYDMKDGGKPFIGDETWDEIQELFGLDNRMFRNRHLMHIIDQSIQALFHHQRYVDYIVADEPDPDSGSRIILIDKATGRLSHGRTLNDNLHAFVEMKEGVFTGSSSQATLQITYQTLFNLYPHIAGVTGTLGTSFKEFEEIYKCQTVVVPDRLPNQLVQETKLYPTYDHLWEALVYEVKWLSSAGYPILIGASSDGAASLISDLLTQHTIRHRTLLSIDTDEEQVIESAGHIGSIVVTTDIMGRGTDIHLTEDTTHKGLVVFQVGPRPNSRVERQFAGRAGRQGLPGTYYRMLCLTDWDDMGWFASDLDRYNQLKYPLEPQDRGDLLRNGQHPHYRALVSRIDGLLNARESSYSQSRVHEFKSGHLVDLIQTSLIAQMDENRKAIKESLDGYHYPMLERIAFWLTPEKDRHKKHLLKRHQALIEGAPVSYLQNALYNFTYHVMKTVIPEMREYGDSAMETVRLGGQISLPTQPEQHMEELMQQYFEHRQSDLTLTLTV